MTPGGPEGTDARTRAAEPPAAALIAVFAVLVFALGFRNPSRLRTFVPGDSGDSLLNLWIMRTVQHGLPRGWHALWNAPNFHPAPTTLAYSDTLVPVALVHWPLRLLFGDVLAFNAVYLIAWTAALWCAYRLAMRFVADWRAAFVGALTYSFASITLVHQGHFQLILGGALVPFVLLLLLRCLDAPSIARGAALGVAFAALVLTSSYHGAMVAVIVVVVAAGWMWTTRHAGLRPLVRALASSALVVAAVAGPFAYEYVHLQSHKEFRRGFEPAQAAHPQDFLSTEPENYLLRRLPVISSRSTPNSRGIENRLFPGFVALVFGAVGLGAVLARRRSKPSDRRDLLLCLLGLAGLVCLVLAFGDWFHIGHQRIPLPFVVFRHLVPGYTGIRATARFTLGFQLALALFVAVGIEAALGGRDARLRTAIALLLAACVIAESATGITTVRVPDAKADGGFAEALRSRPAGVVLELPMVTATLFADWAYVESPRQLEALRDGDPRVNGYSGFEPKHYDQLGQLLNRFPSAPAVAEARRLGVRYVVLRTKLVGDPPNAYTRASISKSGIGRYSEGRVQRMLARLPRGASVVARVPGGYLVELEGTSGSG